ncbi:N-acetylmuramoyl-L-alanine amidase [Denitrobaculum tricleocarpae]|uniref:N-acetylmuramoyl-L-alanine amidase n=1 Tax=Denitrobaculum tricleocarpae TaxID=2591009 RepID=A0A545T0X9_9PROT|nr:N-acetylmuramoyl-L-alanine amidase [Denitrobaculum tricleocarpae]TQV70839.1 N-acetylmuramoyl-L-alanine amidase [Denitrobaculum tricleocarpae]
MRIVERPSPNHDTRGGQAIDILLMHYTGMRSGEEALERLCDPNAEPGRVSAHYCIDEDGVTYRLVPEEQRAWHAGVASWAGESNINARSIGIELINPGHEFGYRPFPEAQMASLIALSKDILQRQAIPPRRVLGHSDVAPLRKEDPGEFFDWPRLAAEGIGVWPDLKTLPEHADAECDIAQLQSLLHDYGYQVSRDGVLNDDTRAVIRAFQRHFRPDHLSGEPGPATCATLRHLLETA